MSNLKYGRFIVTDEYWAELQKQCAHLEITTRKERASVTRLFSAGGLPFVFVYLGVTYA